jgi:radical SAM protein with 4Fe4S-binding SPASM domain
VIPVIRKEVEIREEPDGAIFINTKSEHNLFASPSEAFILTLLDGTNTLEDIVHLLTSLKNAPDEQKIRGDIHKLIQRHNMFVETIEKPLEKKRIHIDPYHFLKMPNLYTRPLRPHTPLSMVLYLTRRCNLNCVYCFADAKFQMRSTENQQSDEMNSEELRFLIDQIANLKINRVVLAGGEPTLRPDLPDIIHYFTDLDIEVFLSTNACLIDDDLARSLRDAGLTKIQAKLDAVHPKTQDRISGVKGSHTQFIKGLQTLKNHSFEVAAVMLITSWNVRELPSVVETCVDLHVDEVRPRIYTPGIWALHGRGGAELNPSLEDVQWTIDTIEHLQEIYEDNIVISPLDLSFFRKYKENEIATCPGLLLSCTILEDGSVVPCETLADFSSKFIMGNVREQTIVDIWNSEKVQKWVLRESTDVKEPCLSCDEFKRCRGGCPWKSIVAYGEWLADPSCVRAPDSTRIPFCRVPP